MNNLNYTSSAIVKVLIATGIFGCFVCISVATVVGSERGFFIALSWLAFFIILSPMFFQSRIDPMQPISFVALSTLIGTSLRSMFLSSKIDPVHTGMLDGAPLSTGIHGATWIVIGLACMAFTYSFTNIRFQLEEFRIFRDSVWKKHRVYTVVSASIMLSIVGFYLFVTAVDFVYETLADLSGKRAISIEGGKQSHASGAYTKWLAQSSKFGYFALLIYFSHVDWHVTWKHKLMLYAAMFIAILFPLFTSARSQVIYLIITLVMIKFYTSKSASLRNLLISVVAIGLIFFGMGSLRAKGNDADGNYFESAVAQHLIGSGNFLPVARTGVIIENIPNKLDYQMGQTWVNWLIAPVPRSVWNAKPVTAIEMKVREDVYGKFATTNGFPPGLLGEGYINFGKIGLVLVGALFGMLLKVYYASFRPLLGQSKTAIFLYIGPFPYLALDTVGGEVTREVVNCLIAVFSTLVVILLITAKRRNNQ